MRAIPNHRNYYADEHGNIFKYIPLKNRYRLLKLIPHDREGLIVVKINRVHRSVARLVYQAYNGNLDSDRIVDYIDGDRKNLHLSNLVAITRKHAGFKSAMRGSAKRVLQFDDDGNLVNDFPSVKNAAETLYLDESTVIRICRGSRTNTGIILKYED